MSASEAPWWYLKANNWHGSSLEVAIELGRHDNARLVDACAAAWASPGATGIGISDQGVGQINRGIIGLPGGRTTGLVISTVRDAESDWLDVAIPMGMLERIFSVSYPLDLITNPWMGSVARTLAAIAETVFHAIPFDLALVGEDVLGRYSMITSDPERRVSRAALERTGGILISAAVWNDLRPAVRAERFSSGLRWIPPRAAKLE